MVTTPPLGLSSDFMLVDVGASGGIADYWSVFGDRLAAVAFDPLVTNMNKMAAKETRPKVKYESAYVGCHDFDRLFPPDQRLVPAGPLKRTSSRNALELLKIDYTAEVFNEGDALVLSDRRVTLDDYFPESAELDFLKIDTDGFDIEVLIGAERLLRQGAFLGVTIETWFQGWAHEYANVFANVDRLLRGAGFQVYDLDSHRYSRAAMPSHFVYDIPAQTLTGQIVWGDALYFRDLAHPLYEQTWHYTITRDRLLKLVALFDLHGLPDCAAELLLARPDLTTEAERTMLLEELLRSSGFDGSYDEHMKRWQSDTTSFYPRRYKQRPEPAPAPVAAEPDHAPASAAVPEPAPAAPAMPEPVATLAAAALSDPAPLSRPSLLSRVRSLTRRLRA